MPKNCQSMCCFWWRCRRRVKDSSESDGSVQAFEKTQLALHIEMTDKQPDTCKNALEEFHSVFLFDIFLFRSLFTSFGFWALFCRTCALTDIEGNETWPMTILIISIYSNSNGLLRSKMPLLLYYFMRIYRYLHLYRRLQRICVCPTISQLLK